MTTPEIFHAGEEVYFCSSRYHPGRKVTIAGCVFFDGNPWYDVITENGSVQQEQHWALFSRTSRK